MKDVRWQVVSAGFVVAGVLVTCGTAVMYRESLGPAQWAIYGGGLLALVGVAWFRRRLSAAEVEFEFVKTQLATERVRLDEERQQISDAKAFAEKELTALAVRLDNRERALSDRLTAYHEWLEFPTPTELADLSQGSPSDSKLADLAKKDRQLMVLLHDESKLLFENILKNKYSVDGKFQPSRLRDDAYVLIERVARIYNPSAINPLLETRLELLLRAGSRACLQFLVVLDELPLNVKEYNIATTYNYVRQAVKAYGMYKQVEPYWGYVNSAFYLGRFAMGANPLSVGAWWLLGAVGKEGAKRLTQQIINRQALALLHNVVRLIGFEVANIYGGDFRYRDANWIYGVELTELLSLLPPSRDSLVHALREIGALQLRGEYDRVFLYRCLAGHVSAQPDRFHAAVVLTKEERQAVAGRLERFADGFVRGKYIHDLQRWHAGVEERLGVKLALTARNTPPVPEQREFAVRSLASFLIGVKEREPEELPTLLAVSRLFTGLSAAEREAALQQLQQNPPFFFEQPDVDPEGEVATAFLEDLALLAVRVAPHEVHAEDTLAEVAAFLRKDGKWMPSHLRKQYAAYLNEVLPVEAPVKRLPPEVTRAVLDLHAAEGPLRFVYDGVSLERPARGSDRDSSPVKQELWLVGLREALLVLEVDRNPKVLWRGETGVKTERVARLMIGDCRLTGGQWLRPGTAEPAAIRVAGAMMVGYETYFRPLVSFCQRGAAVG